MSETNFSWGAFIGGLVIAIIPGAIGNLIAGLAVMDMKSHVAGALIGACAGAVFILLGLVVRRVRMPLGMGMLCGGCVVALIGGACAASMVNTSFR